MIGTVGIDNQGLTGLEASEDELLHGTDGEREVVRDALGDELERDTIAGAEHRLGPPADARRRPSRPRPSACSPGIAETYQPDGATAIVMDPRSSDVLAMANWPGFDPATRVGRAATSSRNMATGFTYEPGSTFKAFTVAGALEDGVVTPQSPFDLPPTIQVADRVIEESHPRGYVTLSVAEILAQSSNVGAVKIGLALNDEFGTAAASASTPGCASSASAARPGSPSRRGAGHRPDPDDYSGSTMGNLPLGQGLSVTPMQMAAAYSAIATDGVLRRPRLVLRRGRGADRPEPASG